MWELDHKESWALKNWCLQTAVLEKTLESLLNSKEIKPVNLKVNQPWIFTGRTHAEVPILWLPDEKSRLIGKRPWCWERLGQEKKGTTEDETVGWHHRFNELEFEQALGDSGGQGSLVFCSPWGHKESDKPEQLNNNSNLSPLFWISFPFRSSQSTEYSSLCLIDPFLSHRLSVYKNLPCYTAAWSTFLLARWNIAWLINLWIKPMRTSDLLRWISKSRFSGNGGIWSELLKAFGENEKEMCGILWPFPILCFSHFFTGIWVSSFHFLSSCVFALSSWSNWLSTLPYFFGNPSLGFDPKYPDSSFRNAVACLFGISQQSPLFGACWFSSFSYPSDFTLGIPGNYSQKRTRSDLKTEQDLGTDWVLFKNQTGSEIGLVLI